MFDEFNIVIIFKQLSPKIHLRDSAKLSRNRLEPQIQRPARADCCFANNYGGK